MRSLSENGSKEVGQKGKSSIVSDAFKKAVQEKKVERTPYSETVQTAGKFAIGIDKEVEARGLQKLPKYLSESEMNKKIDKVIQLSKNIDPKLLSGPEAEKEKFFYDFAKRSIELKDEMDGKNKQISFNHMYQILPIGLKLIAAIENKLGKEASNDQKIKLLSNLILKNSTPSHAKAVLKEYETESRDANKKLEEILFPENKKRNVR